MSGLVEAARFTTRVEADLARLYLESEGVEAVRLRYRGAIYFYGALFLPVRLMVLDEDVELAQRLAGGDRALEQMRDRAGIEARPSVSRCSTSSRDAPSSRWASAQASAERVPERQKASSLPSPASRIASCIASTSAGPMPRMIGTKR